MEIRRSVMGRPNLSVRGMTGWTHYRPRERECLSGLARPERPFDRRFRQRRHDLISGGVWVQAVFGEAELEQSLLVDHGAEVIEVEAAGMRGNVVFQPEIQLEDFLRRALGKH